jgi:hypothetical protein
LHAPAAGGAGFERALLTARRFLMTAGCAPD